MSSLRAAIGAAAALCALLACGAAAPAVQRTAQSAATVTLAVPAANDAAPFDTPRSVTLPAGWRGEVWARVPGARYALWTPSRTMLVAAASTGQIVELVPGTDPAAPPAQRVLASGLTEPQGMAFDTLPDKQLVLYVAESDQIDRYVWKGPNALGARTILVSNLPDQSPNGDDVHRLKGIAIGKNHTIYVTAGSSYNANPADLSMSPPRAAVYSYNAQGKDMHVVATGVRNGEGLAIAPDGSLWTAVNERDQIAYPYHRAYGGNSDAYGKVIQSYVDENPPDEIARLTPGRNLGWPYCNPSADVQPGNPAAGQNFNRSYFVPDEQNNPGGTKLDCAKLTPIDRPIPAHSAPLSITFLESSNLPARWRGGAVVGVHGSWDREPPRAPAVLWLPWNAKAHTLEQPTTLVGGFQLPGGQRWGRPVDAVPGPDGDLYVTDDQAGAIYRLVP